VQFGSFSCVLPRFVLGFFISKKCLLIRLREAQFGFS
jgi:hypothetical protein